MAVAFVQEFAIEPNGDRSTADYDAISARLDAETNPAEGAIFHTAGFDEEMGVFRVFEVWETREAAERFHGGRVIAAVIELTGGKVEVPLPLRQYFYDLHGLLPS
jgi:hypothetical protein